MERITVCGDVWSSLPATRNDKLQTPPVCNKFVTIHPRAAPFISRRGAAVGLSTPIRQQGVYGTWSPRVLVLI